MCLAVITPPCVHVRRAELKGGSVPARCIRHMPSPVGLLDGLPAVDGAACWWHIDLRSKGAFNAPAFMMKVSSWEGLSIGRNMKFLSYCWGNKFFIFICCLAVAVVGIVFGAVYLHFFKGEDIPHVAALNVGAAPYWGQLGDFAGGLLNPILSFLALMAVLKTMSLQRAEMRATQEEARNANIEQRTQTRVYSKQMFESTLFGLLEVQSRILNDIKIRASSGLDVYGRAAMYELLENFKGRAGIGADDLFPEMINEESCQEEIDRFCRLAKPLLGHYFRNLYWILKMVDSSEQLPSIRLKGKAAKFWRTSYPVYLRKRTYTNMVRAQLSEAELALMQINCLGPDGDGLKYYVERYSMLKPLGAEHFRSWSSFMSGRFYEGAFQGRNEFNFPGIEKIRASRVRQSAEDIRKST